MKKNNIKKIILVAVFGIMSFMNFTNFGPPCGVNGPVQCQPLRRPGWGAGNCETGSSLPHNVGAPCFLSETITFD